MDSSRTSFDRYLTVLRIVLTKAPQYFIPFWFAKQPMFWLPHGWFPYYAEWIVSFPRAPVGSVSVASWQLACRGMIALISDLVSGIYGLSSADKQEEPIKAKPEAAATAEGSQGKKKS
jgi:tail-anchored protein insertion receptor